MAKGIQGKEVLVIDDVADVRMLCRKVLENLGLVVTEADSVLQALTHLSARLPHVIILDLHMPVKTGFDFLMMRSESDKLAAIPVIVLTTIGEKQSVYRAISLGADDYVIKPLNANLISQRVRKHVRGLDFLRKAFTPGDLPPVAMSVPVKITEIEDTSFMLESSVRIAPETRVFLNPSVIDTVHTRHVLVSDKLTNRPGEEGRYVTRVNVVGLNETLPKKLAKRGQT